MNEEIETKLDELRKEFETSIKQLEIKQLVVNREIERKVEELSARTTRRYDELKAQSGADLARVSQSMRNEIEMLQIEVQDLKGKLDGNN